MRPLVREGDGIAPEIVRPARSRPGFYADRNMFEGSGEFMPTADAALRGPG